MPELPPWLTQPADPGKAFLQGAQTGSVIAQSWNQNAITRSRLRLGEQEEQLNALKLRHAIQERDKQIEAEFIMAELGERIAPMLEKGQANEARSVLLATAARKTALLHLPQYPELMKDVEAAVLTETVRTQHQELNDWRKEMEKGRNERAAEANDLRWDIEAAREAARNDPNNMQNWLKLENLLARQQGLAIARDGVELRREGTDLRRNAATQSAVMNEATLADKGFTSTVPLAPGSAAPQPDAATQEWLGPGIAPQPRSLLRPTARPLTTANVTANQATLGASSLALREIGAVLPLIGPETVGPIAAFKNLVVDRGLANIWPDMADAGRIEAGSAFARIRASVFRALRSDSNINKDEVASLSAQVPTTEAFLASPRQALIQIQAIASGIQERGIQAARQLNQALPDDVLRSLGDEQVLKYLRDKKLTPEEAERWHGLQP